MNTKQIEKLSINHIEAIVVEKLHSFWQTLDQQNDDAIDGIIFMAKKGFQTGQLIYAQAKTGPSYVFYEDQDRITLKFNHKKLARWKNIWNSKIEPVVLIYVKDDMNCYWADVKDGGIYEGKNKIKINKRNLFNEKTKSIFVRMCGSRNHDKYLPVLSCKKNDRPYLYKRIELKAAAKTYYKGLKNPGSIAYSNPYFADVKFSRLGWNHITSSKRTSIRIRQSLEMLGVVKLILERVNKYDVLKVRHTGSVLSEYLGLRANIQFEERPNGIIQVIVVRKRTFKLDGTYDERKWFLSIHEIIKKD